MNLLYTTPLIFFVIAFFFSMLGMGGAQLYIPILFWLGMDFKTEAIPLGMLLSLINSTSATITYIRHKLIRWRVALPLALTMFAFAPLGAMTNAHLPSKVVICCFAVFTALAATLMILGIEPKRKLSLRTEYFLGALVGMVLGFIAGLIGRGGGSFVVPILYLAGLSAKNAAATSSMVVSFSVFSGFISHLLLSAHPRWLLWILTGGGVLAGSQLGSRIMAKKLKSRQVKLIFAFILYLVSAILIIKDVILK